MTSLESSVIERLEACGALRPALLSETLENGTCRCNICQWRCRIRQGGVGHCRTIVNLEGRLFTTIYGVISSAAADPIEKKPVYHYKPGSKCFSVGSLGCNFRCVFCQNWQIAYSDALEQGPLSCETGFLPEHLAAAAARSGCEGVAWTYNEPSIWLNYTLDCASLCKEKGLYTVYVTNGYATPEALDTIGPYLDVYRVDIKSVQPEFYKQLVHIPSHAGILEVAERAQERWKMHVECVTNVIPGWNDDRHNLEAIAGWISTKLGPDTPWHVTRFYPYGKLAHTPPTSIETLEAALQIGRKAGLKFVYLGNVSTDSGASNTYCPKCHQIVIERSGYQTRIIGLNDDGRCIGDNEYLNVHL